MGCGVSKDDISEPRPLQRKSSPALSSPPVTTTTTNCSVTTPLTAILQDIEVTDGHLNLSMMNLASSATTGHEQTQPPTPPGSHVIISQTIWKPSSQIKTSQLPSDLGALNVPLKLMSSSSMSSCFSGTELTPLLQVASSEASHVSEDFQQVCSSELVHPLNLNEVGANGLKFISCLKDNSLNNIINSSEDSRLEAGTTQCKESGDLYHLGGPTTEELILQISNAAAADLNYTQVLVEAHDHEQDDIRDSSLDVGDKLSMQEISGCSLLDALVNANSISKQILLGGASFPVMVTAGGVKVLSGPIFTPTRRAEIIDLEEEPEEVEVDQDSSSCGMCQATVDDDHDESTPDHHCCTILTGDSAMIADQQQSLINLSLDTRKKLPPLASLHHIASLERGCLNDPFVKPGLPVTKNLRVQQKDGSWRSVSPSQFFAEQQQHFSTTHDDLTASETLDNNSIKESLNVVADLKPSGGIHPNLLHNNSSRESTMMEKSSLCGWVSPSHNPNILPDPVEGGSIENMSLESAQNE